MRRRLTCHPDDQEQIYGFKHTPQDQLWHVVPDRGVHDYGIFPPLTCIAKSHGECTGEVSVPCCLH